MNPGYAAVGTDPMNSDIGEDEAGQRPGREK